MKKLSTYLFLVLFSFSAPSFADDISDFEIEGISIGDSLLDYMSEEEIITGIEYNKPTYNYLTEDLNISYKEIDGGFEFNGWHGFDPHYKPPKDKSWWWVYDDKYVITFGPLPGYTKMKTFQFKRWFPLGYGNIYIAKRIK